MNDLVWLRKEVDDLRGLREHTSHLDEEAFNSGRWKAYTKVIDLIDLIQKNPITVASVKAEVLRLITELVSNGDDISIFEQGRISAFEDILTFIEHPIEESDKKCMYSKDNYTEEDRKVLCGGCEEDCGYSKRDVDTLNVREKMTMPEDLFREITEKLGGAMQWLDDFEEEADRFFEEMPVQEHENIFEDTFKNIARHFAEWQKKKDEKDEADMLLVSYLDGVEKGKKIMRQRIIDDSVSCTLGWYDGFTLDLTQEQLHDIAAKQGFEIDDKVRVYIFKEENV